jgi:FdhE protein
MLSQRFPASGEVLSFYAELASFQGRIFPEARERDGLVRWREPLFELVREAGPKPLREAARELDEAALGEALNEYWHQRDIESPRSFFARVLLQPHAAAADLSQGMAGGKRCPRCGHPPQAGVLRPLGEGEVLHLSCSLCLHEWSFPRGRCSACGEQAEKKLAYFSAPGFEHLRVQACDSCRTYLHALDLSKDAAAIPDVDELTALPLDVWASEKGYRKQVPNLAGI